MKLSVTITLKKDVLDPQGKAVQNTLQEMGVDAIKTPFGTIGYDLKYRGHISKANQSKLPLRKPK